MQNKGEPRLRPALWSLAIVIIALTCLAWSLIPTLESSPVLRVSLHVIAGISMLATVFLFPNFPEKKSIFLILLPALVLRLILLPAPLSDDVNRYLWEGEIVLSGENPYSAPASDPVWENRHDTTWQGMNHRDSPTAYPPGIQWIMAATAAIHPSLFSFKILAIIGDLLTLLLLVKLLRQNAAPLRWLCLYAFNPVVLFSFAAEAHFDSLMVAALLAAILAFSKKHPTTWLWLGLAIQIKLVCLVLVPLFLTKKLLKTSYILPLVLILPGLPFLTALPNWLEGIREFAGNSAFNAPLFSLIASTGLPLETTRTLCTLAFLTAASIICFHRWKGMPLIDSALWMLGALITCSPIVHFWYLTWLLPLTCLRPSFAWATLSITIGGYFLAWKTQADLGWWGFGYTVAALIWLPWFITGLAQNRFFFSKKRTPEPNPYTKLSVIIPVLEVSEELNPLLQTLQKELPGDTEFIIPSPVKTDFQPTNTIVVLSEKGRGNQIAAAIEKSTYPWLLIVHSDTTPSPLFASHIAKAIASRPEASLFVLGQRFDTPSFPTLLIEILNEIRVVFGGVAFGDQTMLIRRTALEACGGFPAQPLMEDVEASMRLSTQGPVIYLGQEWKVSARKWKKAVPKRAFQIIKLVATYQLTRIFTPHKTTALARKMYEEYYPSNSK
ncbi:MAG: hypothetical protein ACSHX7_02045 [Luteolibacter sp.]